MSIRVPDDNFKQQIRKKKTTGHKQTRSEDVQIKKINLFKDTGAKDYYKEYPTEKKMYKQPPTPRTRKTNLVEIECEDCEEVFLVSPLFIKDNKYKCDDCISGGR